MDHPVDEVVGILNLLGTILGVLEGLINMGLIWFSIFTPSTVQCTLHWILSRKSTKKKDTGNRTIIDAREHYCPSVPGQEIEFGGGRHSGQESRQSLAGGTAGQQAGWFVWLHML